MEGNSVETEAFSFCLLPSLCLTMLSDPPSVPTYRVTVSGQQSTYHCETASTGTPAVDVKIKVCRTVLSDHHSTTYEHRMVSVLIFLLCVETFEFLMFRAPVKNLSVQTAIFEPPRWKTTMWFSTRSDIKRPAQ